MNKSFVLLLILLSGELLAEEVTDKAPVVDNYFYSVILSSHRLHYVKNTRYYITIFDKSPTYCKIISIDNEDMVSSCVYSLSGFGTEEEMKAKIGKNFRITIEQAFANPMTDSIDKFIPQTLITFYDGKNSITK